jgi:PilZ domain
MHEPSVWRGRTYRRFRLEFPVRLKYRNGPSTTEIDTVSKDLSLGGLLVRSAHPVPEHTQVSFVLSVHGSQSLRPVYLVGDGEVVRVETTAVDVPFALAIRCNTPVTELEEYLPS